MEHIPTKKSVSELCVLFLLLLFIYSPQPHSTNLIANRDDNVLASFSYFFSCFFYFFDGCNNKLDSREFVMCAQNFHRNNNSNYNKASKTETCLCSGFGFGFLGALTPRHTIHIHQRYICNFIGNTRDAATDKDRATYVKQSSQVSPSLSLSALCLSLTWSVTKKTVNMHTTFARPPYTTSSPLPFPLPARPLFCLSVPPPVVNPQLTKVLT